MLDFSNRIYANILAEQLARVSNALDKREGSFIQTSLGPESWFLEGVYLDLTQLQENSLATTAVGESLDYKVAERGITRNLATAAVRLGVFNVAVPMGARFSTINGAASLTFFVSAISGVVGGNTLGLQSDGTYTAALTSEQANGAEVGSAGNGYTGSLLPVTFIQDLTTAQMTAILVPGTDEEDDDSLRQRYMDSLAEQPFAGNIAAYRQTLLAQDNVGACQVYPLWLGGGTALCSILDANYDAATPEMVTQMQNYICPPDTPGGNPTALGTGFAPIGASVTLTTATPLNIDVVATVQISAATTYPAVQPLIEAAIGAYMLSVRKTWDNMVVNAGVISYPVNVYVAAVTSAIMAVEGVVNVTGTQLNGFAADISLTQSATEALNLQQIPVLGQVVVNEP